MSIFTDLEDFNKDIDNIVMTVVDDIDTLQSKAYDIVRNAVLEFEVVDGRFVLGTNFYKNLIEVDKRLKSIFQTKKYKSSVLDYLEDISTIHDRTIELHKTYNDFKGQLSSLSEAKKIIYNQAKNTFSQGAIADGYIQPVKNLLARQALGGMTTKQALSLIDKWDKGELSSGRLNAGMPAPNLNRYAVQMAKDSAFAMQRTTNDIIGKELGLKKFVYVGGLVAGSRPLCRHLVNLRRPIALDEIPPLITLYPDGLYPNTTKANFMQVCGGYGCNHTALGVR